MKLFELVKRHAQQMKRAGFTYVIAPFYCTLTNKHGRSVLLKGDDFCNVVIEIEELENTLDNSEVTYAEIVLYVLEPYSVLFE